MIRLTLDAQNHRVVIEDNEATSQPFSHFLGDILPAQKIEVDLDERRYLSNLTINDVDFEGFVIALVDAKGNQWSSEVIL